jgi:hypothetical protein
MHLGLTDEQTALLLAELDRIIENDRYLFSAHIKALGEIRALLEAVPGTPASAAASEAIRAAISGPLQATQVKPYQGPLTTIGNAATAKVRLIAARYGADLVVIDWGKRRLKCS